MNSNSPGPAAPSGAGSKSPLFGEIAVGKGLASAAQIEKALAEQEKLRLEGKPEKIGRILIRQGAMSREKVTEVLREQGAKPIRAIIDGFEISRKLGQGGMGAVFLAVQKSTGREVALKILAPRPGGDETGLRRFVREARISARFDHPNIVRCIDAGESNGHHFIAMEFVKGRDLDAILREGGRMDETHALDIAADVARALDHAHRRNLIHRDIKPSNIVVAYDGTVKLLDMGLAKAAGEAASSETNMITQAGVAVGTPTYISPEQAQGSSGIDIRADIYSLGATLFHMLVGRPPYQASSAAAILVKHIADPVPRAFEIQPSVSRAVSDLVERMMAKSPASRFSNPAELLDAIEKARGGEAPPVLPAPFAGDISLSSAGTLAVPGRIESAVSTAAGKIGGEVKSIASSRIFIFAAAAGACLIALAVLIFVRGRGSAEPAVQNVRSGAVSDSIDDSKQVSKKPAAGKSVEKPVLKPEPGPVPPGGEPGRISDPEPPDPGECIRMAVELRLQVGRLKETIAVVRGEGGRISPETAGMILRRIEDMEEKYSELEKFADALEKKQD